MNTKCAIIFCENDKYFAIDEDSSACLSHCGIENGFDTEDLVEMNDKAGNFGCMLLVDGCYAKSIATAWDFIHEATETLGETVTICDGPQWYSLNHRNDGGLFHVTCENVSEKYIRSISLGLSKLGMGMMRANDGFIVDFNENIINRTSNPFEKSISMVCESRQEDFENLTGIDVGKTLSHCRIEKMINGYSFRGDGPMETYSMPVTIEEATILAACNMNKSFRESVMTMVEIDSENIREINESKSFIITEAAEYEDSGVYFENEDIKRFTDKEFEKMMSILNREYENIKKRTGVNVPKFKTVEHVKRHFKKKLKENGGKRWIIPDTSVPEYEAIAKIVNRDPSLNYLTNSPKTKKSLKKGYVTGILYLAAHKAADTGAGNKKDAINVCKWASGQIAAEYAKMIGSGAIQDTEQLVDMIKRDIEKSIKSGRDSCNKKELEEIIEKVEKSRNYKFSTKTIKRVLETIGCVGACLGHTSGMGRFNSTQLARVVKTRKVMNKEQRGEQLQIIKKDIENLINFTKRESERLGRKKVPTIRLNGTSDLPFWREKDFFIKDDDGNPISIMEYFMKENDLTFYDYTKSYVDMKAYLKGSMSLGGKPIEFPKNYSLTFSFSGHNWDQCKSILELGGNVAMAFRIEADEDKPLKFEGFPVIDGDETDLRGLDDKGVIVGLSAKGSTSKYLSLFIISPTTEAYKFDWPEGSPYKDMDEEKSKNMKKTEEDEFYGMVSRYDMVNRFRESILDSLINNKSNWEKYVEPNSEKLRSDLENGKYTRVQNYRSKFKDGICNAMKELISNNDDEVIEYIENPKKFKKADRDNTCDFIIDNVIKYIKGLVPDAPSHIKVTKNNSKKDEQELYEESLLSIVENYTGNDPEFNNLPHAEQLAIQIAWLSQHLASNPINKNIESIDFRFMFGLPDSIASKAKEIIRKAVKEADSRTGQVPIDKVYNKILDLLMSPEEMKKQEPFKEGFDQKKKR
jgi:hypothetical protein